MVLNHLAVAINFKGNNTKTGSDTKGTHVRAPGKDRQKYCTFIAPLKLVLHVSRRKYTSDTNEVTYVCSYLIKKCACLV